MKICLTATGDNLESQLDLRFGRCQYFIFLDSDTDEFEAIQNPALSAMHGAGIQSAQLVLDKKPQAVITGNTGPNASSVLSAAGINVLAGFPGTINEVVQAFKKGELKPMVGPTVPSHFGTSQNMPVGGMGMGRGGGMGRSQGGRGQGAGRGQGQGGGRGKNR